MFRFSLAICFGSTTVKSHLVYISRSINLCMGNYILSSGLLDKGICWINFADFSTVSKIRESVVKSNLTSFIIEKAQPFWKDSDIPANENTFGHPV